ncbi:MAG: DUF3596 domain-containing protein [Thermodesulfobacteriota bacterium]|nr:DUF3596 domain-containing protein [Thermodesulfobacteriota bacterium]
MIVGNDSKARVIPFPKSRQPTRPKRKKGSLNLNREGSVRKINGKVWVDFRYMGERVRESSELPWNEKNAKAVRQQLNRITVAIETGTFAFAHVFPESQKASYFTEKERALSEKEKTPDQVRLNPDQVLFKDYVWTWYDLLKNSGRVSGRTLLGYKAYINLYLIPFFGEMSFESLNIGSFERFISWARKQQYRKRPICNATINKCFVPLKTICKSAAVQYGWGETYNPFFGFKKLPEGDPLEKIFPFSFEEQRMLLAELPDHWKPYFQFALSSGLRQGELIALKPEDVDWSRELLHIRRAMTFDENGKRIEGGTKNRYSRRTIKLIPAMLEGLTAQKRIHDQLQCTYFFCAPDGNSINTSYLRQRVWIPALKRAGVKVRAMKQTRHTFATLALSCGENPLWIARVMGHRNTEMLIKVYSKYVENVTGSMDGNLLNNALQGNSGEEKEA